MLTCWSNLKCWNTNKSCSCCDDSPSPSLSQVSALHVRTKRSLIRAGVTQEGAERLFSQLATLRLDGPLWWHCTALRYLLNEALKLETNYRQIMTILGSTLSLWILQGEHWLSGNYLRHGIATAGQFWTFWEGFNNWFLPAEGEPHTHD